jgi:ketosteroid isomerase-like protein
MDETGAFLEAVLPLMHEADTALHNGDARGRVAMWSRAEPVTLFGAAVAKKGWQDIHAAFEWLSATFANCESFAIEVVAAGASGDLGYIAAIERTTASIGGRPPAPYALRVTTVFRREDGEWKVVHRHADPVADDGGNVARLRLLATDQAQA